MKSEELLEIRLELKGARAVVAGIDDTAKAQARLTQAILASGRAADSTWKKTTRLFGAFVTLEHDITRATGALRRYIATLANPKLKGQIGGMAAAPKGGRQATAQEFFGVPFGEAGVSGEKMAEELWKGFWNSDALGKFLISGWFFNALGGGALIKEIANRVGTKLAISLVARFLPTLLGEVAGATTLAEALAPVAIAAFAAIGWEVIAVVAAVALIAGAFFLAYKKIKWFRDGVNAVVGFIKKHWKALPFIAPIGFMIDAIVHWKTTVKRMLLMVLGPIGMVITAFRHWHQIFGILKGFAGFIHDRLGDIVGWLRDLPGKAWKFMGLLAQKLLSGIKDVGATVGGAFITALIDAINDGVNGINTFMDDVNLLGKLGVDAPNIPEIPGGSSDQEATVPSTSKGGLGKHRSGRSFGNPGRSLGSPGRSGGRTGRSDRVQPTSDRANPTAGTSKISFLAARPRDERPKVIVLHAHLEMNGKQIAESVTRHALAAEALS
ncbi:MAG TPA: hypothetical protein VFJ57_01285 [Solirubrobacterales bacterium]|nr:hypothetical protein [Solirubrobacterales bacterium]